MREIEIKARVVNKAQLYMNLASKNITVSDPVLQHDVVYYIDGTKDNSPDSVWLRLRTENNARTIFTLKQQHKGLLDSIEHETIVSDADETRKIIETLGFKLYSDLTKKRQKARIGEIEICLDDVYQLGFFIEAEKLTTQEADGNKVKNELWDVLISLGVPKEDEVFEGYDVLHRSTMSL
mgnify:CR=1 FL=1